jgi:hypothetical protein
MELLIIIFAWVFLGICIGIGVGLGSFVTTYLLNSAIGEKEIKIKATKTVKKHGKNN